MTKLHMSEAGIRVGRYFLAMSDLDDAIREHLALKRLHGADPVEVARLEEEALGDDSLVAVRGLAEEPLPRLRIAEDPPTHEADLPHFDDRISLYEGPGVLARGDYAPSRVGAFDDVSEETQEYNVADEQIGWRGAPAWQGGAA